MFSGASTDKLVAWSGLLSAWRVKGMIFPHRQGEPAQLASTALGIPLASVQEFILLTYSP